VLANTSAVPVGGVNGDGARRSLVTIVESIDPRPSIFQLAVYGKLIYTVIGMSDRLVTQENTNPHLTSNMICVDSSNLHRRTLVMLRVEPLTW
jgi:hypothetical protein